MTVAFWKGLGVQGVSTCLLSRIVAVAHTTLPCQHLLKGRSSIYVRVDLGKIFFSFLLDYSVHPLIAHICKAL